MNKSIERILIVIVSVGVMAGPLYWLAYTATTPKLEREYLMIGFTLTCIIAIFLSFGFALEDINNE